jgi:hypothetical protein
MDSFNDYFRCPDHSYGFNELYRSFERDKEAVKGGERGLFH